MAIITTKRNTVYAYEPLPDDGFVQTYLGRPTERHLLGTEGIDAYAATVQWAVGIADQMERPITIVPISAAEFAAEYSPQLASLDARQRERLRQVAVASMTEVARNCADPEVREEAIQLLRDMGVVQ